MTPVSLLPGITSGPLPPSVLVASDLHLSDASPERDDAPDGISSADRAFCRWLDHYQGDARSGALLVLNGDTFDFQRVLSIPRNAPDFARWAAILPEEIRHLAVPASISRNEKIFGLRTEEHKAVWKIHEIARAHPEVFAGLARWIVRGGRLLIVKGNHDLELHWRLVNRTVVRELADRASELRETSFAAEQRVFFSDEGVTLDNIWIEHGHRWESVHAVEGSATVDAAEKELRLPASAAVCRYLLSTIERYANRVVQKEKRGARTGTLARIRGPILARVPIGVVPPVVLVALLTNGTTVWLASLGLLLGARLTFRRVWTRVYSFGTSIMALKSAANVSNGAMQVLSTLHSNGSPQPAYAVMGHTHVQQVQEVETATGSAVYVNTGMWNPRRVSARKRAANQIDYRFARFARSEDSAYSLSSLVWDDAAGVARGAPQR